MDVRKWAGKLKVIFVDTFSGFVLFVIEQFIRNLIKLMKFIPVRGFFFFFT